MTMDKSKSMAAMEVERCSKLATLRLQQGFPEKALEAYRNAYKNAQSLSSHGYMLRACAFNMGAMLVSTGNYVEGLAYLNKALPPEGKRDGRSNGDLYFNYGLAYEGLKNITKAKSCYENALKEYRTENDNMKMEAETISRISKFCLENNLLPDANDWMKQLASLYSSQGDLEKELQSRIERSNLLLKMGRAQEAEQVADECSKILQDTTPSLKFVKMYSDLSVAYTQILQYDKAIECSEKAIPLVEDSSCDPRLASVLYQNLGAIYNYKSRFEDAVKYHEKACNTFAKLQMRANQGHCFANMGYAYSQLKNMDKAGECYLHGLQAARDCGDHKTEWQNLEALASVAYNKSHLKKAEQYYQQAITVLAKSSDYVDPSVHERLVNKMKTVIQAQVSKPSAATATQGKMAEIVRRLSTNRENVNYKDLKSLASQIESGNIKVVRRGKEMRYLKVRRSGTLRRFQKVALGLDVAGDEDVDEIDKEGEDTSDNNSDSSDDSEEESNDDSEDQKDSKAKESGKEEEIKRLRGLGARPPDSYLVGARRHPHISEGSSENNGSVEQLDAEEESEDESDDEARVKRLMKQQLTDDDFQKLEETTTRVVAAEVHDKGGYESSESYSSTSTEEDKRLKPPVPDQSPETTAEKSMRTYEMPLGKQVKAGTSREEDAIKDDTNIYSSIRSQPSTSLKIPESRDSDGNEISEGEMEGLSRAQKDVIMYREFKTANKENRESDESDTEMGSQKNSKHCIVM